MKPKNNGHALYAPSSSHRWMHCPGSIALSQQVPESDDTEYSREGTAAHELGSKALIENRKATDYMGQDFNGFKCDKEMAEAVDQYLEICRERFPISQGQDPEEFFKWALEKIIFVEKRFDLSWIIPDQFGTSDCTIYNSEAKKLHVIDYKHGVGVIVDPEWNSQAMMYALGALHFIWACQTEVTKRAISVLQMVETVEIVIVQPRGFNADEVVRTWEISAADLIYWGVHVLKAAYAATLQENAPLRVGSHCRFCPALAVCPEQARNALALAQTEFSNPVLPAPHELTPDQIVKIMNVADVISSWADEVRAYAQKQMELGVQLPGWKLVAKKSNRGWRDELEAAAVLEKIFGENAYEKKLLSVAKAEDALGLRMKKADAKKQLEPLWEKPDAGLTIAPVTDKRPALPAPGVMDFMHDADWAQ